MFSICTAISEFAVEGFNGNTHTFREISPTPMSECIMASINKVNSELNYRSISMDAIVLDIYTSN